VNIVQPNQLTTLLLDQTYMPFGLATAKGAFRAVLRGAGKGLDANNVPFDWQKLSKRNLAIFPDQPCMRSSPQNGEEVAWPIPTVVITNSRFFYHSKKKNKDADYLPSVREVFDFYDGFCCFCGEKIKHIKDASREHVHSKALGGSNGIRNIVLAHKLCNSLAGHEMPKLDINGNEIVPKMKVYPSHFILPSTVKVRSEWKTFLFV
jgi:hypothetical protein